MFRKDRFKFLMDCHNVIVKAVLCLAILGSSASVGQAQDKAQSEKSAKNLKKIESQLIEAKQHEEELRLQNVVLEAEANALSKQLIASAARLQSREAQATATESRLRKLIFKESKIKIRLVLERSKLAELLAGLQRIERSPPPALAVQPDNALEAVRSAMLLGALIPEIKQKATALSQELYNLNELRKAIAIEQIDLDETRIKLEGERSQMADLLKEKRTAFVEASKELAVEHRLVANLGRKAKSLKELLAGLQNKAEQAKLKRQQANRKKLIPLKLARLTPGVKFSKNRKALSFPVQGELIKDFGDSDGFGGKVNGLSIASRALAQVISPNDGTIVYAGKFRGYGELLIINAGEGYHVLLAGMERITAEVGQFVLAGEPVGNMGESAARSAALGVTSEDDRPILYVEFRRRGRSLDPTPWWAGNVKKARG